MDKYDLAETLGWDRAEEISNNAEAVRRRVEDYQADGVELDYLSSLGALEAHALIGKTIAKVVGTECELHLTFTNGYVLTIIGHTYQDSSLSVELENKGD